MRLLKLLFVAFVSNMAFYFLTIAAIMIIGAMGKSTTGAQWWINIFVYFGLTLSGLMVVTGAVVGVQTLLRKYK